MISVYLCYFGVSEPLVQTQVLPYLRELAKRGIKVVLLTFDPPAGTGKRLPAESIATNLQADGIEWHSLRYHKAGLAKLFDVVRGASFVTRLLRTKQGFYVLHARSHVPAAMAMLACLFTPAPMIFDIRGLMAEEYVDHGTWRTGSIPFRLIKWIERRGVRKASGIVVLTERMRDWLVREQGVTPEKIEVIPCCVDTGLYRGAARVAGARTELIYAGSVSGLYLLPEMGAFFVALKELASGGAFFRVLTTGNQADCEAQLLRAGLSAGDFAIQSVVPSEVPGYLMRASIGISFRKPTFAQIGASPTKIPEFLAAGIPVVCNSGIGDSDGLIAAKDVGVVVTSFDPAAYRVAARTILALASDPSTRERCIRAAKETFDLAEVGGPRYLQVYERIGRARSSAPGSA